MADFADSLSAMKQDHFAKGPLFRCLSVFHLSVSECCNLGLSSHVRLRCLSRFYEPSVSDHCPFTSNAQLQSWLIGSSFQVKSHWFACYQLFLFHFSSSKSCLFDLLPLLLLHFLPETISCLSVFFYIIGRACKLCSSFTPGSLQNVAPISIS